MIRNLALSELFGVDFIPAIITAYKFEISVELHLNQKKVVGLILCFVSTFDTYESFKSSKISSLNPEATAPKYGENNFDKLCFVFDLYGLAIF
jgi:hypothetical protein